MFKINCSHRIIFFCWIKLYIAILLMSKLFLLSKQCWFFFCWQYVLASFHIFSQSITLVFKVWLSVLTLCSVFFIHFTQFQSDCSCLIDMLHNTLTSLFLFFIFLIMTWTSIMLIEVKEQSHSLKNHSEFSLCFNFFLAWY